ncbi:helix-turn-helix domain-containing protein [Phenylobacterium soli]|uniref:Chromosomal replication initiator DnaA C-terminal domain-containing protein n=1 Tax=Phenylobacterium soli TaxID=2170551 RepID=A0A328AAX9_9CAUL|nr:helix-turn-helix domain-containing protein [Phenylobacterium soli]RAK51607.1 hypothetical protein DJ017_17375 [Phenylobacterium soli]
MIAANDTSNDFLMDMAPDQIRALIARAAGVLAHETSTDSTAQTLRNIAFALQRQRLPAAERVERKKLWFWMATAPDAPTKPKMRDIAEIVAEESGVPLEELRGQDRHKRIAHARQRAYALIYGTGHFSTSQIGAFFGGRDHTTVLHGIRAHKARMAKGQPMAVAK